MCRRSSLAKHVRRCSCSGRSARGRFCRRGLWHIDLRRHRLSQRPHHDRRSHRLATALILPSADNLNDVRVVRGVLYQVRHVSRRPVGVLRGCDELLYCSHAREHALSGKHRERRNPRRARAIIGGAAADPFQNGAVFQRRRRQIARRRHAASGTWASSAAGSARDAPGRCAAWIAW